MNHVGLFDAQLCPTLNLLIRQHRLEKCGKGLPILEYHDGNQGILLKHTFAYNDNAGSWHLISQKSSAKNCLLKDFIGQTLMRITSPKSPRFPKALKPKIQSRLKFDEVSLLCLTLWNYRNKDKDSHRCLDNIAKSKR